MCTVTWAQRPDGYDLVSNRDERHTRLAAHPPAVHTRDGVRYIAPVDGEFGGSWIAVNEYGLSCCLLNVYPEGYTVDPSGFTSRGRLVVELMGSRSVGDVSVSLATMDLSQFQPFMLAVLEPGSPAIVLRWDGEACRVVAIGNIFAPLVSSSWEFERVVATRSRLFADMVRESGRLDLETLEQFHRSHAPERGPESVCMHRDDASTVSLSIVSVRSDSIEFRYEAGPPCESFEYETVTLARRMHGAPVLNGARA